MLSGPRGQRGRGQWHRSTAGEGGPNTHVVLFVKRGRIAQQRARASHLAICIAAFSSSAPDTIYCSQ